MPDYNHKDAEKLLGKYEVVEGFSIQAEQDVRSASFEILKLCPWKSGDLIMDGGQMYCIGDIQRWDKSKGVYGPVMFTAECHPLTERGMLGGRVGVRDIELHPTTHIVKGHLG